MTHEHQGQCLYCGASNSYSEHTCSRCNTQLPWSTALNQVRQAATTLAAPPQPGNKMASPGEHMTPVQSNQIVSHGQHSNVPNTLSHDHQYCIRCGSAHGREASYCPTCGAPVASPHVPAVAPHAPLVSPHQASTGKQKLWRRSRPQPTLAPAMPSPMYAAPPQIYQPSVNVSVVTQ